MNVNGIYTGNIERSKHLDLKKVCEWTGWIAVKKNLQTSSDEKELLNIERNNQNINLFLLEYLFTTNITLEVKLQEGWLIIGRRTTLYFLNAAIFLGNKEREIKIKKHHDNCKQKCNLKTNETFMEDPK